MPAATPVMVSAEVADPFAGGVTEVGLKEQLAPDGQFVTESITGLLYPAVDVIVTVGWHTWVTVTEDGLAEIEKLGALLIVNETDVV